MTKRDIQIQTLYKSGTETYESLGKRFNLSTERIRQIIDPPKTQYCKEHKHRYPINETCLYHDIDLTYSGTLTMVELMEKLHRLKKDKSRRKEVVYERKKIMEILKSEYKLTNGFISRLINMDITTIKHHLGER